MGCNIRSTFKVVSSIALAGTSALMAIWVVTLGTNICQSERMDEYLASRSINLALAQGSVCILKYAAVSAIASVAAGTFFINKAAQRIFAVEKSD